MLKYNKRELLPIKKWVGVLLYNVGICPNGLKCLFLRLANLTRADIDDMIYITIMLNLKKTGEPSYRGKSQFRL